MVILSRRRWSTLLIIISIILSLLILLNITFPNLLYTHHYEISTIKALAYNDDAYPLDKYGFLDYKLSIALCRSHGWYPYQSRRQKRKVYDLLMIDTEIDWLTIRLNELRHEVDYFVIVESPQTHTGQPKHLHVKENWDLFQPFHSKIIYHELDFTKFTPKKSRTKFHLQKFHRDATYNQVLPHLQGDRKPLYGDILLVGDVNELPRPSTLKLLHNCNIPRRLTLRSRFYFHSFQWLRRGEEWAHPQATTFLGRSTVKPNDLRGDEHRVWLAKWVLWWDYQDLWNAGWFCRGCWGTVGEVVGQLVDAGEVAREGDEEDEYKHKGRLGENERGRGRGGSGWELNFNQTEMVKTLRNGKDLWGRTGESYWKVHGNEDIPEFVKRNGEGYGWLLDRDRVGAGLRDHEVEEVVDGGGERGRGRAEG